MIGAREPCPISPTGQHIPAAPDISCEHGAHEYVVKCVCCGKRLGAFGGDVREEVAV